MSSSETVRHSDLVFDMSLYPRGEVELERAEHLSEVLRAGRTLPPIVIDNRRRVVDGFHRARAHRILSGEDAEIRCEVREYDDDSALLLDAIRLNAGHGKPFTDSDRKRCVALAQRHGVTVESLASVLNVRTQRVASLAETSTAKGPVRTTVGRPWATRSDRMSTAEMSYDAPVGLAEINAVIAAIKTNRLDTHDQRIHDSLRNLVSVAMESLKRRAA